MLSITFQGTSVSAPTIEELKELIQLASTMPVSVPLIMGTHKVARAPLERDGGPVAAQELTYASLLQEAEFIPGKDYVSLWDDSVLNREGKRFRILTEEKVRLDKFGPDTARQMAAFERLLKGAPSGSAPAMGKHEPPLVGEVFESEESVGNDEEFHC